jgi:hypothetical protein
MPTRVAKLSSQESNNVDLGRSIALLVKNVTTRKIPAVSAVLARSVRNSFRDEKRHEERSVLNPTSTNPAMAVYSVARNRIGIASLSANHHSNARPIRS